MYKRMISNRKYGLTYSLMASKVLPVLIPHCVNPALNTHQVCLLVHCSLSIGSRYNSVLSTIIANCSAKIIITHCILKRQLQLQSYWVKSSTFQDPGVEGIHNNRKACMECGTTIVPVGSSVCHSRTLSKQLKYRKTSTPHNGQVSSHSFSGT